MYPYQLDNNFSSEFLFHVTFNRGINMTKERIYKILIALPLLFVVISAQTGTDAIEKARQAKEAAEKAAAEAAAATEAAIEQAAQKAAAEARSDAKRKKEEDEARRLAEEQAAEEAELDAAAAKAAEAAKRKMAAELGLEYEEPEVDETVSESDETTTSEEVEDVEDVVAKESLGWNVGAAASVGLLSGETFTNIPTGGTFVITTPFGFKMGSLDFTLSLGFGGYSGSSDGTYSDGAAYTTEFNPSFAGVGGNFTLSKLLFAEGHVGTVGEGTGIRGFAGVTLERLMNNSLNLPVNILIGSEVFYSTDMAGVGNSSGWASLGLRLDYDF